MELTTIIGLISMGLGLLFLIITLLTRPQFRTFQGTKEYKKIRDKFVNEEAGIEEIPEEDEDFEINSDPGNIITDIINLVVSGVLLYVFEDIVTIVNENINSSGSTFEPAFQLLATLPKFIILIFVGYNIYKIIMRFINRRL